MTGSAPSALEPVLSTGPRTVEPEDASTNLISSRSSASVVAPVRIVRSRPFWSSTASPRFVIVSVPNSTSSVSGATSLDVEEKAKVMSPPSTVTALVFAAVRVRETPNPYLSPVAITSDSISSNVGVTVPKLSIAPVRSPTM